MMGLCVVCLSGVPDPAAAEEDGRPAPARPEEGKGLGKLPWQSWIDPAIPDERPPVQRLDRIVYAFDTAAKQQMIRDGDLSRLCRRGQFNQVVNMRYRAFGPDERPLGVAYGRMAVNLYDPLHRRYEDTVYFFKDQDTALCTVYTAKQEDLRRYYIGP